MPAHIYARTGDHAAAAKANFAGAEADRVYLKTAPPGGFYGMAYYTHNLHFLADSHMMQGRFAESESAIRAVNEGRDSTLAMADMFSHGLQDMELDGAAFELAAFATFGAAA